MPAPHRVRVAAHPETCRCDGLARSSPEIDHQALCPAQPIRERRLRAVERPLSVDGDSTQSPAPSGPPSGAALIETRVLQDRGAGLAKSWISVTELMDTLGHTSLTGESVDAMSAALARVGLLTAPALTTQARSGKVRLLLAGDPGTPSGSINAQIRATVWRPDQAPADVDLCDGWREPGSVLLVEVGPDAEVADVYETLARHSIDVSVEAIDDLLHVDDIPTAASYGSVHKVSTVAVFATEAAVPAEALGEGGPSKAGALTFQPLEILAGPDYLIVCWHGGRRYSSGKESAHPAQGIERFLAAVAKCWVDKDQTSAGTLGLLMFRELARTYSRASRNLYSWLELWDLDFNRRGALTESQTLCDLRVLIAEFHRRVNHLDEARYVVGELGWFPGTLDSPLDRQLDSTVDRTADGLVALSKMLRSAVDLLTTAGIREQLRLGEVQARHGDRLQGLLAIVTSVLLVPTFFAGMFGANTTVPGQGHWSGFVLMLTLMTAGGVGTYALFKRAQSG
jgi:hypothetical protein